MKTLPLCLATFICCMHALPALAQRESFDATVTHKVEVTVIETLAIPLTTRSDWIFREGWMAGGGRGGYNASKKFVSFDNIFFKFDSAELRDRASELIVDDIAGALKSPKLKDAVFLIEGHTCDLGEDEYNFDLSARRAEAIRQMLIKRGISSKRLVALGFGESEIVDPVKRSDTPGEAETRRMKSRRVVLRRLVPEPPVKK